MCVPYLHLAVGFGHWLDPLPRQLARITAMPLYDFSRKKSHLGSRTEDNDPPLSGRGVQEFVTYFRVA